jgi:hypothetical protein
MEMLAFTPLILAEAETNILTVSLQIRRETWLYWEGHHL